jgi:hypothetical protein
VTLTVHTSCVLSDVAPTNIALVVDSSSTMHSELTGMKKALDAFVVTLDLPGHPNVQVAVVKYSSAATTLCKLTNDAVKLHACIGKLDSNGGTAIDAGIRTGMRELVAGRPPHVGGGAYREIMILTTDGSNNAGCGPVLQAADQTKSLGIVLATVALGSDSDATCMAAAATPGLARVAVLPTDFTPVFQELARLAVTPSVTRLQVADRIPPNMRLEPGTVKPAPVYGSPDGPDLRWEWWYGPAGDYVVTYAVTPLDLGDHPVNVKAEADLAAPGRSDKWVFPIPRVRVVDNTGLATPTPFPTPTPGVPPLPQPTWYPTPVPTSPPPATRVPGTPYECPGLARLAPAQAIADALANPARIGGWNEPCNPSLPPGPRNPTRTTLGLQTVGKPYHPVFNGLVFKCGCP